MENIINRISICPHCKDYMLIEQLNCGIFRHGVIKTSGQQIPPHASKQICDELYKKNLIYGCGLPFQIINRNGFYIVEICDYI
jgi:hypothetical protein